MVDIDLDATANALDVAVKAAVPDFTKVVQDVVLLVEQVQSSLGPLTSDQKKQLAVKLLQRHINLPVPLSWCEGWILGKAVDLAVTHLNLVEGHTWPTVQK